MSRSTRSRVRFFFFGLAALWGFTMGAAVLVIAVSLGGHEVRLSPLLVGVALPGVLLSVLGGLIAAAAYRQNRRHGT